MAIGAAAMLSVTGLIGDSAVVERRAQDEELLKLRAYWAAQGHLSYAISRMTQGPACGNECQNPAERRNAFQGFFDELNEGAAARDWSYPEISASYFFPVAVDVRLGAPFITAAISFPAATTAHPLIGQIWPVRRGATAFICSGVAAAGDPCPSTFNGLTETSGISFVSRIEPI